MKILKLFGNVLLGLLVLGGLFGATVLLTVYYDWSVWRAVAVFFALGVVVVITFFLLVNVRVFSKWLWHRLRRLFKFESQFKYISWQHFKKGLNVQGRRCFMPLKWFSAAPPPWYLMIDLFNSGSEQLLQDRHMAAMRFTSGSRRKRSQACRWWFFRHVMYLSVPGSFIYQNENIVRTWYYLTRWIWLWCRRPAGVIISLPANTLYQQTATEHHLHARLLRHALGVLFKRLEKRLPIYLMMTNLQQLPGAEPWLEWHDETHLTGMTGVLLSSSYFERVHSQVNKAMDTIFQSLCLQRLNLLNKNRTMPDENGLLFPETIKQLRGPLTNFLSPLCEKDIYMEYGVLSGILLTAQRRDQQGEVQGIFSQYLLESALPGHQVNIHQQRVPGAWWLIRNTLLIVLGGVLCFFAINAFCQMKNDEEMLEAQQADTPVEQNYLRFVRMTDLKEQGLYHWFFNPALNWLIRARASDYHHSTASQTFLPTEINSQLLPRLQKVGISQQAALITQWADFINSEQQIAAGASLQRLNEIPEYSASLLSGHPVTLTFAQLMAQRKAAYILGEKQHISAWQQTLRAMLASKTDLSWLLSVPLPAGSNDIRLSNYWPLSSVASSGTVSSAYEVRQLPWIFTQSGEKFLSMELDSLQRASGDTASFRRLRETFWQDYLLKRQNAWLNFASQLLLAESKVSGKGAWHEVLLSVMHTRSPYDRFMTDLSGDLSTIGNEQAASWLVLFRDLQHQQAMLSQSGLFSGLARNRMLIRGKLRRYQRVIQRNSSFFNDTTLGHYKNYLDGVQNLAHLMAQEPDKSVSLLTGEGKNNAPVTLNTVFTSFSEWQRASSTSNDIEPSTQVLWALCQGNARLLRDYLVLSAADQLQNDWNNKVLWPLNAKITEQTDDAEGIEKELYQHIVAFIQKNAVDLLVMDEEGIASSHWQEKVLPLTTGFINYVNEYIKPDSISGQSLDTRKRLMDEKAQLNQQNDSNKTQGQDADGQSQTADKPAVLTLEGRPATANPDAVVLPVGTSLRLMCTDGDQRLINMNFNTQARFSWTPQRCRDVILTIIFPQFHVQKIYPGNKGLVDFLQDYSGGEHRYTVEDFSASAHQLKKNRIRDITVRYQLFGQASILASLQAWDTEQQQQLFTSLKQEDINTQLRTIDTPQDSSGILSELPKNIITAWQLTGNN